MSRSPDMTAGWRSRLAASWRNDQLDSLPARVDPGCHPRGGLVRLPRCHLPRHHRPPLVGVGGGLAGLAITLLGVLLAIVIGRKLILVSRTYRATLEKLTYENMHDRLTGLSNQHRLLEKLRQIIDSDRADDARCGVMVIDLDRFKALNDNFLHPFGDAALREVAKQLENAVRERDLVARLGGDEFGILLPGADEAIAIEIVKRVLGAFSEPLVVEGRPVELGASIGISLYPDHGRDTRTLLERADRAMYVAKKARTGWAIHSLSHPDDELPE